MSPTQSGLVNPPPGNEVVISGLAGYFPKSNSVMELQENLFKKLDLVSDIPQAKKSAGMPTRIGKINKLTKFDSEYFGQDYQTDHYKDPMFRLLLERCHEAIIDAGLNPVELQNTKTGVYVASCYIDSVKALQNDKMNNNKNGYTGCSRAMLAIEIANWLKVTGPCYTVDSACSSSLAALEHAYKDLREGRCDTAIVGGANLCLLSSISHQYYILGVLSKDGRCKSFDNSGNGYVRSEAIVACILQKAKFSRRIYAQIVHIKTNCDGFTERGITHPSKDMQMRLLKDVYEESSIEPKNIDFFECHGTGTKAGDPAELGAIDAIMCSKRSEPLLIGSIKSNMGHTEPASGLSAIAKLCIAYNTGYIPPNINFWKCREDVTGLVQGRLQVVTDKRPWNRGLAGVSSFGFGGVNAHTILKNIARDKEQRGLPRDDLPRLVCVSGRTASAVAKILDSLENKAVDVDEVRLWHSIHEHSIPKHGFRGYTLLDSKSLTGKSIARKIEHINSFQRKVCFLYTGVVSNWTDMAAQLMKIRIFAETIKKCHEVLKPKDIDLINIMTTNDSEVNFMNSSIGEIAVQIGLTDVLSTLGVKPDYIIGEGAREIACAYADGYLTAEQAILVAYYRSLACTEVLNAENKSFHVALGLNKLHTICPPEILIMDNDLDSSIITGSDEIINNVINQMKDMGIKTEQVIPDIVGLNLLKRLNNVIPSDKISSERWLTSYPKGWTLSDAILSSVKYQTQSTVNSVLFKEACDIVPPGCIVLEINTQIALEHNFEEYFKQGVYIGIGSKLCEYKSEDFYKGVGGLFLAGLNPRLANIYPHVPFPVSQGTPMLSHLVEWDHREDWFSDISAPFNTAFIERAVVINLNNEPYLKGHVVDGRNIYPGMGYVVLVWKTLARMMQKSYKDLSVVFEDVRFERGTVIPKTGQLELSITIHKISGEFEISEKNITIVTGRVYIQNDVAKNFNEMLLKDSYEKSNISPLIKTADFYKDIRLRGFGHCDNFQGIKECNDDATYCKIAWINNWVTFLDNLLQTFIIRMNSSNLSLSSRIQKLSIDTKVHYESIKDIESPVFIEAYGDKYINTIRSKGVEIRGAYSTPVVTKPTLYTPVLEKHVFVPFYSSSPTKVQDALRIIVQLIQDNIQAITAKFVELDDKQYKLNGYKPILRHVDSILHDHPINNSILTVINEVDDMLPSTSRSNKLDEHKNVVLIIGANLCKRTDVRIKLQGILRDDGFILSREKIDFEKTNCPESYNVVSINDIGAEYLVLLRKKRALRKLSFVEIKAGHKPFSWIENVKTEMRKDATFVIYSEDVKSGLLGFINCLRKEPGGDKIRSVFIKDRSAPPFDANLSFYREQLEKDLVINVFEDGHWGTYRHLLLKDLDCTVPVSHAFNKVETVGDLSSFKWFEGPLDANIQIDPEFELVHVYCAALNFRDIMTASGRVAGDTLRSDGYKQEYVQGLEVAGRTANGTRVIGMTQKGISNMALCPKSFLMAIPDEWSFEEAATVFVTYSTVYLAFIIFGKLKRGESVLIHAGTGGVGQAAINVALDYGCEVFTTVGTPRKREFIKKLFPQLKDSHIGCSRDTSFEEMIQRETKGKGVDVVLNCLAEEKLLATARCLAHRGRFLEIGIFDILKNTQVDMYFHQNEISFHGVILDLHGDKSTSIRKRLINLMTAGIVSGAVRPLTFCTFEKNEVESAFRYMAAGEHIGKVIIKIRDEEPLGRKAIPAILKIEAVKRYFCRPDKVYILVGGLGGFGLELADWLVLRGARKIVFVSRRGVTNGYQSLKIRRWRSSGIVVEILTQDLTTESGCKEMFEIANFIGPVEAVFHLAVVLKDATLEHQTTDTFESVYASKVPIAINLDNLTRILCPELKDFVLFSSYSCGFGNPGQTNYAFANSVMERICEKRKKEGLPALTIQWGAIGDVGVLHDMFGDNRKIALSVTSIVPQSIASCLKILDKFLKQDAVVVSCYAPAENTVKNHELKNAVDTVAKLMGIKDLKTVSHQTALAKLGMHSMAAMEIKQTLERNYDIILSSQEIRTLTFARLKRLCRLH